MPELPGSARTNGVRPGLFTTEHRFERLWLPALWLSAFLVYASTTARDILPADSGEFQLIAAGWGIGHPPGYPLYTVVSALWVRLVAIGTLPYRANMLSAALAASTVAVLAKAIALWATAHGATPQRARGGGTLAALALGTASTFWAQATTANIRMPTMLFVSLGYLALARYKVSADIPRRRQQALIELAIVAGLGVGHHPSLAFVAVGWLVYLLWLSPRLLIQPQNWSRAALVAAMAWLLPQLYLPVRGAMQDVPLNPGGLASWQGFWDHVLARGFGGDMLAYATSGDLALRVPLLPTLFRMQFPALVLIAIAVGWLWLLHRDRGIALSLLTAWLVQTFVTITYRAPQTVEYLMPAYVPMALALGLAVALRPTPRSAALRRLTTAAALIVPISLALQLPGHVRDFATLAADTSIRARTTPLLEQASSGATILADWHWATPLWVLQAVESLAPDVTVTYVYPEEGRTYEDVWYARAKAVGDAALFTTHAYAWDEWAAAPVGGGYRLYPRPLTDLPVELGFSPTDAILGPVRLLGTRWSGVAQPGATLELQLAWQAVGPQEPAPSFATRLWDLQGTLISTADRSLDSRALDGEVGFATLVHQIPVDRCSPVLVATVGVYTVSEAGFEDLGVVSLPPIEGNCTYPTLPAERIWPGVVLDGGPFLRGIDYDVRGDGTGQAYVHWCGPGAPVVVEQSDTRLAVEALGWGQCRTVELPINALDSPQIALSRPDGSSARLVSLPLPAPKPGERYLPFGTHMVLVGEKLTLDGEQDALLTLRWRTAAPQVDDYAVSTRLLDADGTWLGMHDIQPGLGAIPTLKWVTRGDLVRDPHPFTELEAQPRQLSIAVYERFRLTPLRSAQGDVTTLELPE